MVHMSSCRQLTNIFNWLPQKTEPGTGAKGVLDVAMSLWWRCHSESDFTIWKPISVLSSTLENIRGQLIELAGFIHSVLRKGQRNY